MRMTQTPVEQDVGGFWMPRTEGMGLNAAVCVFKKAKNTMLAWERKCAELHQVLLVYALLHQFLQVVREKDMIQFN